MGILAFPGILAGTGTAVSPPVPERASGRDPEGIEKGSERDREGIGKEPEGLPPAQSSKQSPDFTEKLPKEIFLRMLSRGRAARSRFN